MAKSKKIAESDIISFYMNDVLENNKVPSSVYLFSKQHQFEEAEFYKHFSGFEKLEKRIFKVFLENTMGLLKNNEEFQSFDARNKLLSFYYTFFELLTANRSFVIFSLNEHKNKLKNLEKLSELKESFSDFIEKLEIETMDLKQKMLLDLQQKGLQQAAWVQLLLTLHFWIEDTSSSFEKTDVFIEKSVHASFDLLAIRPMQSLVDLGKFLFKEKMKSKF